MAPESLKRIVTPGELHPGQFITAYDVKRRGDDDDAPMLDNLTPYKGAVFEVVGVDLPYVAVKGFGSGNRSVLDSRLFTLMELRREFIDQLKAASPSSPPAAALQHAVNGDIASKLTELRTIADSIDVKYKATRRNLVINIILVGVTTTLFLLFLLLK